MEKFQNTCKICQNPWNYLVIAENGNCYFCCYSIQYKDDFYIGNILEQDINEIWNGERAQAFRQDLLDKKCTYCNLNTCYKNYTRLYDIFQSIDKNNPLIAPLPVYIQLNHDPSCSPEKIIGFKKYIDIFNNLIDSKFIPLFANVKILSLKGTDEIFDNLHSKKILKKILETYPEIKTEIWSNGIKFTKENVEKLNLIGRMRTLYFSIHAADEETYRKIWRTNNFNIVKTNLEYASELRKSGQVEEFTLTFSINKENYKNMNNFVLWAEELGATVSLTTPENCKHTFSEYNSAVFKQNHYLYNDFVRKLKNPIIHKPIVCLDFNADIKPVSYIKIVINWFQYIINCCCEFFKLLCNLVSKCINYIIKYLKYIIECIEDSAKFSANLIQKTIKVITDYIKQKDIYISCEYIQHGFKTDLDDIKMCEWDSHEGGGNYVIVPNYKGQKINWNKVFKEKRKIRKQNKKGIILDSCQGCHMLKKRYWDTHKDYISYIYFNHWTTCNCTCNYCYLAEEPALLTEKPNYNIFKEIKDLVKMKKLKPGGMISFGGGEPTCLEEFEPMINLLIERGFDNIHVYSSGINYSYAIEKGVSEGKLHVVISADSGTPETFLKIKKVNAFNEFWENMRKYAEAQKDKKSFVRSKYIIIPGENDSKTEIKQWLQLSVNAGVEYVIFDIEGSWYDENRNNVPQEIYDVLDYGINKTKEYNNVFCELYINANDVIKNYK